MQPFLQLERENHIIIARMNRPESRNALTSPEYIQEFVDLCAEIRRDRSIKVLVSVSYTHLRAHETRRCV